VILLLLSNSFSWNGYPNDGVNVMKFVVYSVYGSPNEYGVWRKDHVKLPLFDRWCKQYRPGHSMRMTRSTVGVAFLAIIFVTIATPAFAEVYKWVDENGHAHYTEQPPKKGEHTQLHVQPGSSQPQSESTDSSGLLSRQQAEQKRSKEISAKLKIERDLNAERDRVRAENRKINDQQAEMKAASDKREVDACKRNHEVYCDKGVDKIRQEAQMRNEEWERARNSGFR
jgi:hypothetical protein